MAFEQIQSLDADTIISLGGENRKTRKKNQTQVEGYYLGKRMVKSPKSKTGLAAIHFFQTQKGNLGVWGKTDSDRKLSSVDPGTMVRITFNGLKATPNGDMYTYKVEQDKDNRIAVETASFGSIDDSSSSDGSDSDDTYLDSNDERYESENNDNNTAQQDDEAALAAAAAAREKRRQDVEARLNGKGKKA